MSMSPMDHNSGAVHGSIMDRQSARWRGSLELGRAAAPGRGSLPARFQEGEGVEGDLTTTTEDGGAAKLGQVIENGGGDALSSMGTRLERGKVRLTMALDTVTPHVTVFPNYLH
jgi:hypothetical protein